MWVKLTIKGSYSYQNIIEIRNILTIAYSDIMIGMSCMTALTLHCKVNLGPII